MTEPAIYTAQTPRIGLPLLFAGQAQKEMFVNEALARIDALLHCSIEAELASPPSAPDDGTNWLVAAGASGAWSGREGAIACRQAGNWLFASPRTGMRVFDRSTGQDLIFFTSWRKASAVSEPVGGSIVDGEARAAVSALITALQALGFLPHS